MKLKGKKILVTGSEGFIGSHLVEALVRSGARVTAFILYNSFNSWGWIDTIEKSVRDEIEIVTGDVRDPFVVANSMQGCDIVYHLASLIAIPYSYVAPNAYVDTNINGTLNVVQSARTLSVEKVVHTSTSEVYGTAQYVPIDEAHPLKGQSPYAASKIGADQIAMSYFLSYETPVTIIRPFNTYGPRQSARAVIPTIILQLLSGEKELKLGATDTTRDFNFIEDTVSGFISIGSSDKTIGEVINIGSMFDVSIKQIAMEIGNIIGCDFQIVSEEKRLRPLNSEVQRLLADNRKAYNLMGWEPRYGGIEGLQYGLKKTIEWFSNIENQALYKADRYNI